MNKGLYLKAAWGLLQLPIVMAAFLFLPAWTLDYWEAWVFIGVFFACTLGITLYLAIEDPKLLERRMTVGPAAEREKTQKVISGLAILSFAAPIIVPAIDHRFGWSVMPTSMAVLGNALIILSFIGFFFVFRANTYGASTIQVTEGQRVISTGPYAIVRHPMYSAALLLMFGIPLALGSWWGLVMFVPAVAGIVWRLLDEEDFLSRNLTGYVDYMRQVPYRLVPLIW